MKTKIVLERQITVHGWHVTGDVAFAVKREWEPAILKLALERGFVTPELVRSELLDGRPAVASRMVLLCERLQLLEKVSGVWVLTAQGKKSAETGLVLVPRRGSWTLWATEDPLIPDRIIAVTLWNDEPAAYDEVKNKNRRMESLPDWVRRLQNLDTAPVCGDEPLLRIGDLGQFRGERVPNVALNARLEITPTDVRLCVSGALEGNAINAFPPTPNVSHTEVWLSLLRQANLFERWDSRRQVLCTSFHQADSHERMAMRRVLQFTAPQLDRLGKFADTFVSDVPLFPDSRDDARLWANWRLENMLHTYVVGDAFEAAHREAITSFHELAPPCPDRHEFAKSLRGANLPPPAYWWLQAPTDWVLGAGSVQ